MTTGNVALGAPATPDKYVATYTFTEDALTKLLQRVTLSKSDGNEIDFTAGTAGTPAGGVASVQGVSGMTPVQTNLNAWNGREYETVAASQTDQALGATGAAGDDLDGILIVPGTSAAGAVSIKDGSGSSISIFAGGGTTALTSLIPFYVPIGARSLSGAWKVTTGANVTAIGFGNFT